MAVLASVDGVAAPSLNVDAADYLTIDDRGTVVAVPRAMPRARSAPMQALLETFRN